MRLRLTLPLVSLAALFGCQSDASHEPLVPLDQVPVFAVRSVSPTFDASSFAMLDGEGEPIYEAWVTSGLTPIGLTGAIHVDNAMPSVEALDGSFTIIDRYGANRVTRFQFPEGTVLGQMRTQADEGSSSFESNPYDVAFVDATHALVSRYGVNLDPAAVPLDQGTDLVEFDPTTMTLTGARVDLSVFDTTVDFQGDQGTETLRVPARPARMVKTSNGFVVVGLERLSEGFEAAAEGMVAVVDLATYEVTGHALSGLANCGLVLPVPGAPDSVAVRCLGYGVDPGASAGLVVLDVGAGGAIIEAASYVAADHPDLPNATGNALMLTSRSFVGVDHGIWGDPEDPDVVYLVDLETASLTPVFTAAQGMDVFGSMAYYPPTGRVLVPSQVEGLHRLRYEAGALVHEDTITLYPESMAVLDVSRIL